MYMYMYLHVPIKTIPKITQLMSEDFKITSYMIFHNTAKKRVM